MSGLCGIVQNSGRAEEAPALSAMLAATRGPGAGEGRSLSSGATTLGVVTRAGLLSGVAERMLGARSLALAFHGSLYGPEWNSASDAATAERLQKILDIYLASGSDPAWIGRLRGDFSLALWDGGAELLLLATDRFQIHPVLYHADGECLLFASRMRGLLASPHFKNRALNPLAVLDMVDSSVVHGPDTIFANVRRLSPGQVLIQHGGRSRLESYWQPDYRGKSPQRERELADEVRTTLSDAIAARLGADGPPERVGTFLSGGVDSSTVTGLVTQLSGRPTHAFSIGFGEQSYDEMRYARIAAQAFGARHHEYVVTAAEGAASLPLIVEAFDDPFGNASAIATYYCARLALQHGVPTLYAGDGGDELFAGNSRYAAQRTFEYYDRVPGALRAILKPVVTGLAKGTGLTLFRKGASYIRRAEVPYPDRLLTYGLLNLYPPAELLTPEFNGALGDRHPYRLIADYYRRAPANSELDRQLYLDLNVTLADTDIPKVARMCEPAGVLPRFPFLDQNLVDLANRIPSDMLMPGRTLRAFFKKAYADLLPPEVLTKTKHGFGVPVSDWLLHDPALNEMMRDLVLSPRSLQRGFFSRRALEEIVERHRSGDLFFYGRILWNLMVLEAWLRRWLDGRP